MHRIEELDKETTKLYELLKSIDRNKNREDKVWDNFCKEMNKEKEQPKKYFKKHPKTLSNSSSEILSCRLKDYHIKKDQPNKAKSANSIRYIKAAENIKTPEISDTSIEVVTLREEFPLRKSSKPITVTTSDISNVDKKPSKSCSRKTVRIKDDVRVKHAKVKGSSSQDTVTRKSTKHRHSSSEKHKEEKLIDSYEIKMHAIIEKSLICLEDIRIQLDKGISLPDGLDDLERRRRRSTEFASRFSRNYLYQLNRQIGDIRKLMKPSSARTNLQNHCAIRQKLTWSYQTVLQGLQAYLNHLPTSTPIAVPEKVKELLKEITTLCDIQRSCVNLDINSNVGKNEIVDIFEVRSRCLIEKIDERFTDPSVVSLLQSPSRFAIMETQLRNKNLQSRYSMYNGVPNRKDLYWKKAVVALAKKKFNVQSKYKTAHFKHRPPAPKPPQIKPVIRARPLERKSSTNIKTQSVMNDENVRTMMGIQKENDDQMDGIGSVLSISKTDDNASVNGDPLRPLLGKLLEKMQATNKESTREHVKNALQNAADGACQTDDNVIQDLKSRLLSSQENVRKSTAPAAAVASEHLVEKIVEVITKHGQGNAETSEDDRDNPIQAKRKRRERKKTITVTGVKNAKLICIKDEDSINEPSHNNSLNEETKHQHQKENIPQQKHPFQIHNEIIAIQNKQEADDTRPKEQIAPSQLQPPASNDKISKTSLISSERMSRIKISRLPKIPLQPLKMLPKKFALNILENKINYLKARKGNPMYKKSAVKQPWTLMGEISDKILDELLQAIGAEIQVDDVIDRIFASEFV